MSRLDKSKVINSALELLNEVGIEGLTTEARCRAAYIVLACKK